MAEESQNIDSNDTKLPKPIGRNERLLVLGITMLPLAVFLVAAVRVHYIPNNSLLAWLPFWGFPIALVVFLWGWFSARKGARSLAGMSMLGAILSVVGFIAAPVTIVDPGNPKEHATRTNLIAIQAGLETYAKRHQGTYPSNIAELVKEGILKEFPRNPYTRQPMKEIAFGSSPFEGEFTFVPVADNGVVLNYYLFAYGGMHTDGMDLNEDGVRDHVIIMLERPGTNSNWETGKPPSVVLPDLKDLLNGSRSTTETENPS